GQVMPVRQGRCEGLSPAADAAQVRHGHDALDGPCHREQGGGKKSRKEKGLNMSLTEELQRLADLRQAGVLSEDEFVQAKARVINAGGAAFGSSSPVAYRSGSGSGSGLNRLRRSVDDRWLGGVCGGIAKVTGIDSWVWRLLTVALIIFGGVGILFYVLLW